MNAEILAIGSELLLGETIDTNSAYLAQQLAATGINLFRKSVVGDNEERIAAAISEALDRADLIICTGGLGPTADDVTREAVARALQRPLVFHQHLLEQIEARFRAFGRPMPQSNRRQAYTPEGARIVENPRGTAPAFIVEDERGTVVVLPGVPSEMRYLWEHAILPYLRDERGETSVILVRTLHAVGLGESVIGEMLSDLMTQTNPTLGISAKRAQYELRIGAKANNRAEAEAMIAAVEATIRERLGANLLGDERLDQIVARLLRERGKTIALHEGVVSAPLYRVLSLQKDARAALRGVIIHPADIPADDDAAQSLARTGATAVRHQWRADIGLALQPSSVIAPDGFATICVAIAHDGGVHEWRRRFDMQSEDVWDFAGTMALDALRLHLAA
ncbi:CinA family nicotinamide mononucleotide deamidase-related protein [Roseiflexus sp.]|uniref:CinA family nicotinamide mononucleotide deamidase-related protein n=1 Tax=Roseiflexus sp. TaxID=2562120 RepID=UPI00398AE720